MAGEIQADYLTGRTLYAQVRSATATIWNTAGGAFEAYNTANIADYDIALTEQGTASGYYAGNMPAATGGVYNVIVKVRAGGAPAESDITIAAGQIEWDGSAVEPLFGASVNTATVSNNAITAAAIADNAIDAASIAADAGTEIGAAVWASATRTLTSAANITSTGGTTVPQTGDSFARIGANGASLTAVPWNAAWDAEVQSEVDDAIAARFTFTVAGFCDANVQYVNDVQVGGVGTAGNPWGPV